MQRVRVGITGLAFVFLLVLLGMVFTRPSAEEPITPNTIGSAAASGGEAANESEPKEPLAELGVAPGNADNSTNHTPGPSAVPADKR